MVAVRVTDRPKTAGFCELVTLVVVALVADAVPQTKTIARNNNVQIFISTIMDAACKAFMCKGDEFVNVA